MRRPTMNSAGWPAALGWLLAGVLAWIPQPAGAAAAVSASEAERRVREFYVEGFPFEAGQNLSAAAVDRLAEMLTSDAERSHQSNIVLALGLSGSPRAFASLAAFAARTPRGEATPETYRAHMALPLALGHLARSHPAAFELVARMARREERDPGWSFQSLRGVALAAAMRRSAVMGLAASGRPEAEVILNELAAGPTRADPEEWALQVRSGRALRARVASEGPERAFGRSQTSGWTRR